MTSVVLEKKRKGITGAIHTEYHIIGLEDWDFFETLAAFFSKEYGATVDHKSDGLISRSWQFRLNDEYFIMEHHDDMGNWFYSCNKDGESDLLKKIAHDLECRLKEIEFEK